MAKEERVYLRISKQEKERLRKAAHDQGFQSITAFLLWLFRKYGKA